MANLYLKVRPRITSISKNPPDSRVKMTKDKEEDDLPPNKEAKLAQGGEEARSKGGGHTSKKRHHLELQSTIASNAISNQMLFPKYQSVEETSPCVNIPRIKDGRNLSRVSDLLGQLLGDQAVVGLHHHVLHPPPKLPID